MFYLFLINLISYSCLIYYVFIFNIKNPAKISNFRITNSKWIVKEKCFFSNSMGMAEDYSIYLNKKNSLEFKVDKYKKNLMSKSEKESFLNYVNLIKKNYIRKTSLNPLTDNALYAIIKNI